MGKRVSSFCPASILKVSSFQGLGREAPCYQDDRTFLFPKPSVYRDGAFKYQPLRTYQSEWVCGIHHRTYPSLHEPNVDVSVSYAPSSYSSLRSKARGRTFWSTFIETAVYHLPQNVLLRHPAKSAIKVIDFGSSCLEHEKSKLRTLCSGPFSNVWHAVYTYIQSRFYRSPEVILGMNYHMAIDMWSLGCILAELYTGYPIFPGENEQEQLSCIMEVLGVPDKEFVNRSSRKKLFFGECGQTSLSL